MNTFQRFVILTWMAIGVWLGLAVACAGYDAAKDANQGVESINK